MKAADELKFWRRAVLEMSAADWALFRKRYRTSATNRLRRARRPGRPRRSDPDLAMLRQCVDALKASSSKSLAWEALAAKEGVSADAIRKRFERNEERLRESERKHVGRLEAELVVARKERASAARQLRRLRAGQ